MKPPSRRLEIIAELVERSASHQRVLSPVALAIGAVALTVAITLSARPSRLHDLGFEMVWAIVATFAIVILAANFWRQAVRKGDLLLSQRTLLIASAIVPSILAAAAVSFAAAATHMQPLATAGFWMIFYGLGLTATQAFAPRSLFALGWVFLLSGLALLSLLCARIDLLLRLDFTLGGYWIMGCTFGLYHLAYGWLTWPDRKQS
jgi:hypothetical protein